MEISSSKKRPKITQDKLVSKLAKYFNNFHLNFQANVIYLLNYPLLRQPSLSDSVFVPYNGCIFN